jgi:hypothetical protein
MARPSDLPPGGLALIQPSLVTQPACLTQVILKCFTILAGVIAFKEVDFPLGSYHEGV